jgi:LuxR family maltose regulon positive regulatory protein
MQGQLANATKAFREVLEIGKQLNNLWTMSTGYVDLGMVLRLSGSLTDADALYREGLDVISGAGTSGLGYIGRLESFFASTLYEQNLLDEAMQLIASSIAHNELWRNPNHVAHAYMVKARILMGKGDRSAEDALRQAGEAASHPAVVQTLRMGIDSLFVQFWLANGQQTRASHWLESHPLETISGMDTESRDLETLTYARVLIAQEKNTLAWKILEEVERDARAASRIETLIRTLTLKALAAPTTAGARKALEAALNLGIPEGYLRTFMDEGDGILSLLKNWQGSSDLVKPLLDPAKDKNKKVEMIITARELDILRGMAEGLSNKEIGQRLFISAGTVKAHSASIYRKLEVENRTEAIARAKDMGLI